MNHIIQKPDEVSSGFIIYRRNEVTNIIEYLILQSSKNRKNWTPPKGILMYYFRVFKRE